MAQAAELLIRAGRIIQDEQNVRWPLSELADWLNAGLLLIASLAPELFSVNRTLALVEGTRQQLPADCFALLRFQRNANGRAVRIISRDLLDAQVRDWHDPRVVRFSPIVKHTMIDEADPNTFWVYPGNDGTGRLDATVARRPMLVEATGDAELIASYAVAIDFEDTKCGALLDYMLFRAFSKDAQYAGNSARATAHYTLFSDAIVGSANADAQANPNVAPTAPGRATA